MNQIYINLFNEASFVLVKYVDNLNAFEKKTS